ncbi:diphthine--ammonia ligase isoform X3 [Brienomyrus brachyistius]|uniref:diphthine--ammonia ligase isoform X3 n=1 Tax=Brienomyrus brachyistius TaxID=42636 RepID=UPI0020B337E9|nr:diphthine--ammonia ligase isoform X3 [Brienomyrus brachyistius]
MKVVAMISGGKDSCYNMMQCVAAGHEIVALANLQPSEDRDELDSYMYQTVGHQAINLYAEALGLPLYRRVIEGSSLNIGRGYRQREGDEVEDMYHLLKQVKEDKGVEAVSVGAILSDYQRVRVENVCARLHLQPLAYLWHRDQEELLSEMITSGLEAIIIKVAAFGLDPEKHLGKSLVEIEPYLKQLSEKYGVHVCGEGGEYESITLDCPLFKKKILIDSMETVIHSADAFAPVGFLRFLKMHTEQKANDSSSWCCHLQRCPCQNSIEEMEHADKSEDTQDTLTSKSFSSDVVNYSQQEYDTIVQSSNRTTLGYQWICDIAGSCSEDQNIHDQTKQAFSLLQGQLKKNGSVFKDIVLVHLYLRRMADFAAVNSVYQAFFEHDPPARVCLETLLPGKQLIQMDCLLHHYVGLVPEGASECKHCLHVQSLSHWAPANIGPYSQAVKVDDAVFCAGQIALVPCRMQLVEGGPSLQASLALHHVVKVLEAIDSRLGLCHVLQVHCYVTHKSYIPVVKHVWDKKLEVSHTEQDSYGAVEEWSALLVAAVVPCLPRHAAVEFHVIATSDQPRQRISCRITVDLPAGYIECRALQSSTQQYAALSLSLSMHSDPTPMTGQEILKKLSTTLHHVLQKVECSLTPICGRAFYKHDSTLGRICAAGLSELFKNCLDQRSSAVTLVPVQCLSDSQVLHLSCWLSL